MSVITDITVQKRDVCALAGTTASKSLVYKSTPVLTDGAVLVISPAIALVEDQSESGRKTGLTVATHTSTSHFVGPTFSN